MSQQLTKGRFLVTVITDTPEFLEKKEQHLQTIKSIDDNNTLATLSNKTNDLIPIYAVVKRGVKWTDFQVFPWRQIHFYTTDKEFDDVFYKIKEDAKNWKKIQT
jgi:hypothetical protein